MPCVILIGGGGNCKKIIDILLSYNVSIDGILDDVFVNQSIKFYRGTNIIGKISDIVQYEDSHVYVTIGNINFRRNFFHTYRNYRFPNLIHKTAYISESAWLGKGIIVHHGVYIGSDAVIGDFCHIDTNSSIEHDCRLGINVMVCPLVSFCGYSVIQNHCFIGTGTTVNNSSKEKQITIENNCMIGSGSVITKTIPENVLYYGTPPNVTMKPSPNRV